MPISQSLSFWFQAHRWLSSLTLLIAMPLSVSLPAVIHADVIIGGCTIVSNPTAAHFTECPGVNLTGANLSGVNLSFADLSDTTINDANLSGANLTDADVSGARLIRINLSSAKLFGTDISLSNLSGANLANVTWNNTICPDNTTSNNNPDKTCLSNRFLPSITASAKKADNTAYTVGAWTNQNVTVHFACTAVAGHTLASCTPDQTFASEGSVTANGTATDTADFFNDVSFGPIRIDKTKPTISGGRTLPANTNGWNNSDVTVSFTCADNQNGSGLSITTVTGTTISSEGADQAVSSQGVCNDNAGNTADAATVDHINIDKSAPETTITTKPDNPSPLVATFVFSGADALSGVITFQCSLDGAPFTACTSPQHYATLAIGQHTFQVQAGDAAGNLDASPASYSWTASGDLPVAKDQTVTLAEDTGAAITLQATGKNTLTYTIVSGPAHGALRGAVPMLTYTPIANFNGIDSFTFRADDGQFNSNLATVTINVTPVNDPLVVGQASLTVAEDTPLSITLDVQDVDGDGLTYALLSGPLHGSLRGPLPTVAYTPMANFNGADSFDFSVSDGATAQASVITDTVYITVNAVNDAPVATQQTVATLPNTPITVKLTASDAEDDPLIYTLVAPPQHGALSGAAPDLLYTPVENFSGNDQLTFQASDGQATSNIATVVIRVTTKPFWLNLPLVVR